MYKLEIRVGYQREIESEDGGEPEVEEFEHVEDSSDMPIAGDDLEAAKAEAQRYAKIWNPHVAAFAVAAKGEPPEWKQRTVNKKRVHDLRFDKRPESVEAIYVILRVFKVEDAN